MGSARFGSQFKLRHRGWSITGDGGNGGYWGGSCLSGSNQIRFTTSTLRLAYRLEPPGSPLCTSHQLSLGSSLPFATPRQRLLPILASTAQNRGHAGHSHKGHSHDTTYLTSTNKNDPAVRITRIGLVINLGMAAVKGIGGYVFNSRALMADAFHSLTDLVSDFMTLATISWSLKPASSRFPSGYGKIESLGSLGVSGLLLGGGVFMAWNACEVLYVQLFLDAATAAQHALHAHGHSHAAADTIPDIKAAWIAAGTIVIKEWLYRASKLFLPSGMQQAHRVLAMKIARERKSSVLASNAVHHRIDSLTGLVAFIAVGGSHLFNGLAWLDPVGSLLVSLMVIKAGWSNTSAALLELADVAVDDQTKSAVREAARKSFAGLTLPTVRGDASESIEVRDIQGVKAGQNYLMDIEIAVPKNWSLQEMQDVEDIVRKGVGGKVRGVRRVKIRFIPLETSGSHFMDEFIGPDLSRQSSPERHLHEPGHSHDQK